MKRHAKNVIEGILSNRIWIEPATSQSEVENLIQRLHPKPTATPLVRIGREGDGGYVIPDDFDGVGAMISPGVSSEVSFDLAIADLGISVYMADASVDGPPVDHPNFKFVRKFLDVFEDERNLRLDTLLSAIPSGTKPDRILQMDIEGAEYRVILDASKEAIASFRIMIIEFHALDRIFSALYFKIIEAVFNKLLQTHEIVHIHPNNASNTRRRWSIEVPPLMEFTFLRKDRFKEAGANRLQFPNALDRDNVPNRPSIRLPACWRS